MNLLKKVSKESNWLAKWYPRILTGASLVGLVASFWQVAERVHMLKNPEVALSCTINPVVDCSGVLGNKLSALFGFPNALLGIVMFSILLTAGLLLLSGGKFSKNFHLFVLGVSKILFLFSVWFFAASLYSIGKVCIFCVFIWAAAMPIFWLGTLYWLESQKKRSSVQKKIYTFGKRFRVEPIFAAYLIMIALFLYRFRDFYFN